MPISHAIRYSPAEVLHFDCKDEISLPKELVSIQLAFSADWRFGWFKLASEKPTLHDPAAVFWQEISTYFLTSLCHLPIGTTCAAIDSPIDLISEWVLRAPPMVGGEYLSKQKIVNLWNELNEWFIITGSEYTDVHQFLEIHAPYWQKVGRVCFHLAENKSNADRPFAFLATYSTGFGVGGKLKHLPLNQALNQYSGANNRQALIKLLTPIQQASKKCQWVEELMTTAELYQPLAWTPHQAYKFLSTVPQLEESGLSIKIPNWWKQRPRPQVSVTIGSTLKSNLGVSSLLDFNVQLAIGDSSISESELMDILASNQNLVLVRGQWIEVDKEKLHEALAHWKQIQKHHKNGQISFFDGMRLLAGAPTDINTLDKQEDQNHWTRITAGEALAEILQQLRNPAAVSSKNFQGLQAELRPYQHEGVSWLSLLSGLGLGACLADDMGLGKTIQILSLLLLKQQQTQSACQQPSLLIVPASLLSNWQREAVRFAPSLEIFLLHPSEMKGSIANQIAENPAAFLVGKDLVITTYSMITKLKWLTEFSWDILILDEAQAIKNSGTKQTKAAKALKSQSRIALTGTPIENRLSDLWSLFDFLNPGLLGSSKHFKDYVNYLQNHPARFDSLRKLTNPYILRRMKTDPKVISDLPDKIESSSYCHLTIQQAQHYQAVVEELRKSLELIEPKNRRGIVLKALLQLKQICNHPCQYSGTGIYAPSQSGKFERLGEICEELALRQEKVLIFTQFSEIIAPLEEFLEKIFERKGLILHGGTPMKERKQLVEQFQRSEGPPFFILSLKAGGTGLTLTEASHVIHFDRWWNPAVENQATDRAFRIGQKKNVLVHKLITQGTIEEKIDEIITSKKELANEILTSTDEVRITELSNDELMNLITLDLNKAMLN